MRLAEKMKCQICGEDADNKEGLINSKKDFICMDCIFEAIVRASPKMFKCPDCKGMYSIRLTECPHCKMGNPEQSKFFVR